MKILIIDDDVDIRRIARYSLETLGGMDVLVAADGHEGVVTAKDELPDAILLDVMMPGLDGIATLGLLREEFVTADIPVIFLTAKSSEWDLKRLRRLDVAGIITKPFNAKNLGEQLEALVYGLEEVPDERRLEELRKEFIQGAAERLDQIRQLVTRLEEDPSDRQTLTDLLIRFHHLAGSGGSYGFSEVSSLSRLGEHDCEILLREELPPSSSDLERWHKLAGQLEVEIAEPLPDAPGQGPLLAVSQRETLEVLMVDPEDGAHFALSRLLDTDEIRLLSTSTGLGTLSEKGRQLPAALIVNNSLHDGSGYELIRQLRSSTSRRDCVAILVNIENSFPDKLAAIRVGADASFGRPVDWENLAHRLTALLERGRNRPGRVLLVASDPPEAASMRGVLEPAGYEMRVCSDPKLFEDDLSGFKPDLILMDIALPEEISGFELARYVRLEECFATTPIVFLAGSHGAGDPIEGLRAGGDDFLARPVPAALLVATVAARIERARMVGAMAERDPLTGVLSQPAFFNWARNIFAERQRDPSKTAVLAVLDLDGLEVVNDTYGQTYGDALLRTFAAHCRTRLRPTDIVSRFGEDEIAIVIDGISEASAVRMLNRIREDFSHMPQPGPNGASFGVTFSGGVAGIDPSEDVRKWIKTAWGRMKDAKAQGRNRIVPYAEPDDEPTSNIAPLMDWV